MLYCYFNASCFLVLIFSIESIHFLNKLSPRKIHFLFLLCQIILILVQEPKSIRRIFSRTVQVIYHIIHFQKFHIVQSCMQLVRFPNQVHRQSIIAAKYRNLFTAIKDNYLTSPRSFALSLSGMYCEYSASLETYACIRACSASFNSASL